MATSDANAPAGLGGRADRRSPPAASQSKRDRKRQALMERLSSMTEKFQREKDLTYRDQLQKIQFDTNLVQRFDPYDPRALEVIAEMQKEHRQAQGTPVNAEGARSLLDMAGIKFSDFIDEVEDLIELRDFQLAQSKARPLCDLQQQQSPLQFTILTRSLNRTNMSEKFKNTRIRTLTKSKRPDESIEP